VSDVEVFAYQTNWKGDYERNGKGVARIHGTAYSDGNGKVRFITIYPRGYNDSPTGEHVHFEVKAKGYKNANREIMFSDGKRALPSNPEAGWVYLHTLDEKNGKLEGTATMFVVKN
jgi:protocatechuate 3,4-dioxygenase beta subunit